MCQENSPVCVIHMKTAKYFLKLMEKFEVSSPLCSQISVYKIGETRAALSQALVSDGKRQIFWTAGDMRCSFIYWHNLSLDVILDTLYIPCQNGP